MTKNRQINRGALSTLALVAATAFPLHTNAAEVTLKSADGTVDLTGEFVDFDDNSYIIRTSLGNLRVSASRVSCEGDACPVLEVTEANVNIVGSDTVGNGIMQLLLSGYAGALGAEVTQTVTGGSGQIFAEMIADEGFGDTIGSYRVSSTDSADAFEELLSNTAHIGMSARRIQREEAQALRTAGAGNMISPTQEHIIAIDNLVVITHPDNPVSSLTTKQLRAIYAGIIRNWAEVGGPDAPIQIVDRAEGNDTRDVFLNSLFDQKAPRQPSTVTVATDNNDVASIVTNNPNAIGYVGFAFQRGAKSVPLVNDCGITMTPDAFSARTEEYALQRFLYLYNRADVDNPSASDLIRFAVSDDASNVITKAGFIDLGIERQNQSVDSDRAKTLSAAVVDNFEGKFIDDMLTQMQEYDRLSTTFRFRTGSSQLNPRGRINLEQLARYVESQPEGAKLMFVGFTDDVGAFDSNRKLSVGRAQQVMAELQSYAGDRLDGVTMDATGYGEVAPAACNTTENGRRINRRVEVWIQS
ncbi:phosphate ABC transporter substrate-binding/OmpA family protein [Litoreibacter roseus]|uniref:OmpA family protein n=1 Tax=Litoreibacter roseus TaxID=2601869 RepID=A0A6N6JCW7_9RHOB|nr:phosphate ABC transporter substrate-binding/OmpA family protein [Litoreibacter roseus]GFE63817.1 OmpA family protein [Litoreibacter roseus]